MNYPWQHSPNVYVHGQPGALVPVAQPIVPVGGALIPAYGSYEKPKPPQNPLGVSDVQMTQSDLSRIMSDPNIPPSVKEKLMQRMFALAKTESEQQTFDKQQIVEQEKLQVQALTAKHSQKIVSGVKMRNLDIHAAAALAQRNEFNDGYMVARQGRQEHLLGMREQLQGKAELLRNEIEALKACREGDMAEVKRLEAVAEGERKELKKLEAELYSAREETKKQERLIRVAKRDMPVGMAASFAKGKVCKLQGQIDDAESALAANKSKELSLEQKIEEQKEKEKLGIEEAAVLRDKHSASSFSKLNNQLITVQAEFDANEKKINSAFSAAHKLMEREIEDYE